MSMAYACITEWMEEAIDRYPLLMGVLTGIVLWAVFL